jgi:hypothetical protein
VGTRPGVSDYLSGKYSFVVFIVVTQCRLVGGREPASRTNVLRLFRVEGARLLTQRAMYQIYDHIVAVLEESCDRTALFSVVTLCNNPEERISQLLRGGSLKSLM